ncbi:hypothetical protein [Cryptosporangium minutisporangium]|uniref:Uncharacterized protein n=1 Tax=Cryptosporangium minutisporangium TaxID=113569 RepID=A0ABP6SX91_9ACTN
MAGRGPLEYLVVQFPGDELPAGAARTLEDINGRDDVLVIEAMLILRGAAGVVRCEDFTDVAVPDDWGPAEDVRLIDAESVVEFAGAMVPGEVALALILEHRTRDVVSMFQQVGGRILASTRLPDLDPEVAR